VVQDADAYQRILDIAVQAHAAEGIRQGLEDAKEGKVRPAREFFDEYVRGHTSLAYAHKKLVSELGFHKLGLRREGYGLLRPHNGFRLNTGYSCGAFQLRTGLARALN
jgi:hypothetical protein